MVSFAWRKGSTRRRWAAPEKCRSLLAASFFLLFPVLFVQPAGTQTDRSHSDFEQDGSSQPRPQRIDSNSSATDSPEVGLLKQQNQLLERHNSELLQVVVWSLTFAAVFLIGVLGLIGFFTIRRYDQEKEALKVHLEGQLATIAAASEARLTEKAESIKASQEATARELREGLSKQAESTAKVIVEPLSSQLKSVATQVNNLELDLVRQKAESWEAEKVFANALRRWCEFVELANDMGHGWRVTDGLDQIQRLLRAGVKLDGQQTTEMHALLTSLPGEYEPLVTKIKKLL